MIKNLFKIALTGILLTVASSAYALQFGEYEVTPGEEQGPKTFNICIQQGGDWYISSGDKGWKGKWLETLATEEFAQERQNRYGAGATIVDKEYIIQAIHSQEGRMRSLSISEGEFGISGAYLDVAAPSGKGKASYVDLKYKGSRCAPFQDEQVQAKQAPVEEIRKMPSVGNWQIMARYIDGEFKGCGAALQGDYNFLAITSTDMDHFELHLPPVDGLRPGSTVRMQDQIGNLKPRSHDMIIDQNDGSASMELSNLWIGEFFDMAEGYPEGTMRDTYHAKLGNVEMNWNTGDSYDAFEAITQCYEKLKVHSPVTPQRKIFPQSNNSFPEASQYGPFTAISIDRQVVQDVISQGEYVYVKLAPGYQSAVVKRSEANKANYGKWYDGSAALVVKVSSSDNIKNKKGYTYRISTSAKFIEYYVGGKMILHLKRN